MSTHLRFASHLVHRPRFVVMAMVGVLLCTLALLWQVGTSAQPMCPIDKIWSEEEEACVDLEPTAEPTVPPEPTVTPEPTASSVPVTSEPTVTPEPTASSVPVTSEPTIPVDGPPTSVADDQAAPTTEAGVASPEAGMDTQFSLGDWWDDLFGFDAPSGILIEERTCDHVIDPTDTMEEILPRCRGHYDDLSGAPGITYDVFINDHLVWTSYNEGEFWRFWNTDPPGGDYRIVARYHGEQYKRPIGACAAWDNEQEEPLVRVGPGPLPANGDLIIPDVPAGVDQIVCIVYYIPIVKTEVTVDLVAYRCPQRVVDEVIVGYRDLVLLCGVPGGEVEMQVIHSGGVANQITHLGLASFDNLSAGAISVREVIPDGYGVPLVYCMVTGPEGQTIKQQDLEIIGYNYYVTIDYIPPGSSVLCEFFNVPGETPEFDGPPVTRWQQQNTSIG